MRRHAIKLVHFLIAIVAVRAVYSHGLGPSGIEPLEWSNDQISQVTSAYGSGGNSIFVAGRHCIAGGALNFYVRDDYAFDINEVVWLDVDLYMQTPIASFVVSYDSNGPQSTTKKSIQLAPGAKDGWYKQSIPLEHARFANLGFGGSDFSVYGSFDGSTLSQVTICGLSIRRSFTTPVASKFGWVAVEVVDEKKRPTPARVGIYDATGRLPLPSDEALVLRNVTGVARVVPLNVDVPPWPAKNRNVFYTDGRYHSRLPDGQYEIIVSKGPEYRVARRRFTLKAGQTQAIKIELERWADMAKNGWYSGEDHIHYERESAFDDRQLQILAQAEDLKVSNILHMGNVVKTYFAQHAWESIAADGESPFVIIPGQEDPRTSYRGHTIQLNIRKPVRNTDHYLLYHEVFERVRALGGLTGYAHVALDADSGDDPTAGQEAGLAVDVPFGLVDFIEVLQGTRTPASIWFDFLNLGYKLSPAAGTDYPYAGIPGSVRNYVKVGSAFTAQAWFDALKEGRTFVSSGPMLDMRVNGFGIGSELHVRKGEPLVVEAETFINPDLGSMHSLELIEQGDSVKEASSRVGSSGKITLRYETRAAHGTWFVVRARSDNAHVLALSAPVYVVMDGNSFWKPEAVPAIVAKLKLKLQALLEPPTTELRNEPWESRDAVARNWESQLEALKTRVGQANAVYDDLVRRATELRGNGDSREVISKHN